jgi:plastocyanin
MATATATMTTRWYGRKPLAAWGKLAIAALVGIAAAVAYIMFVVLGITDPMGIAFIGIPLVAALLIATGWRWTPVLAAVVGGLFLQLIGPGFAHFAKLPSEPIFSPMLIVMVLSVLGGVAGISATVQNYRRPLLDRRMPRWLPAALLTIAGVVLGAIMVAQVPPPNTAAGVSSDLLPTLPVLETTNFEFAQTEITVKAGETVAIRLQNNDQEAHFFDVDELNVHAPVLAGEEGLVLFKPTEAGTYTFYCAPHYDKETGEGMRGTLIVEQ